VGVTAPLVEATAERLHLLHSKQLEAGPSFEAEVHPLSGRAPTCRANSATSSRVLRPAPPSKPRYTLSREGRRRAAERLHLLHSKQLALIASNSFL
jgi:hypothetical protein